jgi:hypothetical protein
MNTEFKVGDEIIFLDKKLVLSAFRGKRGGVNKVDENPNGFIYIQMNNKNLNRNKDGWLVRKVGAKDIMEQYKRKNRVKVKKALPPFNPYETVELKIGDVVRTSPDSAVNDELATVVNIENRDHQYLTVMIYFHDKKFHELHYEHCHTLNGFGFTIFRCQLNKVVGAKHPFQPGDPFKFVNDDRVINTVRGKMGRIVKYLEKETFWGDNYEVEMFKACDRNSGFNDGRWNANTSFLIPLDPLANYPADPFPGQKKVGEVEFKVGDRVKSLVDTGPGNPPQREIDKGDTGTIIRVPGFSSPASSMYYRVVFDKFNWEENNLYTIYAAPMLGYEIEKIA